MNIESPTKKQQQILNWGKDLFFKFGPKRVTIDEICKKAKLSRVTFYKYYSNKNQLLLAIRKELMDTGFGKFDEISELDIEYSEKIKLMSKWRYEFFSTIDSEFLHEILEMDDVEDKYNKLFLLNITKAQAKGEIREGIKPELILAMTEKLHLITKEGLWKEMFHSYADYQDQVRTILFFGMLRAEQKDA